MQKRICTLFISSKILILSVFRANLKNDQKIAVNVQFSHPFQMICTNTFDCKETLYLSFICRDQISHH